ncbi:MAG: YceI family protein [Balneolales bacterium]|nr:YceI family protein [Balneolales bacterium]
MKKILALILIFIWSEQGLSQTYYSENGKVTFYSKVPLHNFEGNSESLVGLINVEESIVDFYLDLETLKTGNGKRDKDMRLTLDTETYPFAEFYGTLTSDFDMESATEQEAVVSGSFSIHGISKDVEISGTLLPTNEGVLLKANWILSMDDYDIDPPKLLIMKVDDEQEIKIEILLTPYSEDSK